MTIRRVVVRREQVTGWPVFRGLELPNDLAALAIEIARSADQAIDHAVGDASAILESSLTALEDAGQLKLWLVVVGGRVRRTDRVGAYRARREKVWGALEREGVAIPPGLRRDLEIPLSEDSFGLVGIVELEMNSLRAALSVTRHADAVCLATHALAADLMPPLVRGLARCVGAGASELLVTTIQLHANWTFASRAFGEFDDNLVGVEVFASDPLLDVLEPITAAAAAASSDHHA